MATQTYYLKTFGCQQNVADSERIASYYEARGMSEAESELSADTVIINSCMVRDMAEERVYGYIRNLGKKRLDQDAPHIILTGCIVGAAMREPSGKMAKKLQKRIPHVTLLPLEDVGFEHEQKRGEGEKHAWVIISNGCNNFCTFCIVPFSRGKEVSRPYEDIVSEVRNLQERGFTSITLLGQNVNSYGSDLVMQSKKTDDGTYTLPSGKNVSPVMVTHLGRHRIPTLFPYLLQDIADVSGIENISFTSSNPWDFSDELIDVFAKNTNIDRLLHLPVQSGSNRILKKMNRWYSREQYIELIAKIRAAVPEMVLATDIIVGFPSETEEDFNDTLRLVDEAGIKKAFIAWYSPRPGTAATGKMTDDVSWKEKKRRWHLLNEKINLAHRGVTEKKDWIRTIRQK